ncbi:ABC transporter permease [Paenibacillus eucommiae]|uniref:Aldouronate transport system permease protein n=1 Tax=Paenibacillus eucommiae TaxID=1355755 RepID=A0ABS4J7E1_9BACL|nr:ABC transporter permease subunit [Paenibacillus eucommiae]MBP1995764.1 putative aldouronate transport system permease protein [Paenibacillus eucommiae]
MKSSYAVRKWRHLVKDRHLMIIFLPCLIYLIVFRIIPILWNVTAFQDYKITKGILKSKLIYFEHFITFFHSPDFVVILKNTLVLGVLSVLTYPVAIIFALLLNELRSSTFKKGVQTISYLPFFISIVVLSGITWSFLSPDGGIVNQLLSFIGIEPQYFMAKSEWFAPIYIFTLNWQHLGYNSIVFIAAIAGISPELFDAAEMDGCNRFQKMIHVTLPGIAVTIAVMLIISAGNLIMIGFERALLLQTPATYGVSDVIGTYVYRVGIQQLNYGLASAVGLFESVVSLVLLMTVNYISNKVSKVSIW